MDTTHRIFQDAVCYYIFCLIGLARNAQEPGPDGSMIDVNPLWRTLTTGEQGKRTNEFVRQFMVRYLRVAIVEGKVAVDQRAVEICGEPDREVSLQRISKRWK